MAVVMKLSRHLKPGQMLLQTGQPQMQGTHSQQLGHHNILDTLAMQAVYIRLR